jgi:hypothetical protein
MNAKWQKFKPPPPLPPPAPQSRISRIYTRKARNVCTYERQGNRTVRICIQRLFTSKLIGRPIVPTFETYVHVREISAPMSGGKIWPSKCRSNRCRWAGALLSGVCVCLFLFGFLSASAERNCRRGEKTGRRDCRWRAPMSRRRRRDDDRRQARMGQAHGPTCICLSLGWRVPWRWR